ncbi:MAG TPA: ATP-binding cassette domain-containing protein, partial [archaeon]|nr:ATP-binding cassette domain-containing protein [archaeon]
EAKNGEIFGLLGPNGAGKTTTIRIMLNLIENYKGSVEILGGTCTEKTKDLIGYLPEERGLYKNVTALEAIKYLASLKGMQEEEAEGKALQLMREMNLMEHKDKKIFELSKGTQQKIQIISSIIHNPSLFVLDEPFSGLDPISVKFIIEIIEREKNKGKAIILSTHNMNIAEQVCERVMVINKGRRVLYGNTRQIKERYSRESTIIELAEETEEAEKKIGEIIGIKKVIAKNANTFELLLDVNLKPEDALKALVSKGLEIRRFETTAPSLESIFLTVVESEQWMQE